jgi:hypothetical protein
MSLRRCRLVGLLAAGIALTAAPAAAAATPASANSRFCNRLGHAIGASAGAQM